MTPCACQAGKKEEESVVLVPISFREANRFIERHHRHHAPARGHKFSLGCEVDGVLVGVATVGRPVSRMLDNGLTLEVNRTCTDGTRNANSFLYGACQRVAFAMGYKRLVTYTLPTESGASLRGAGWVNEGNAGGGSWSRTTRKRGNHHPIQQKIRWATP